LITEKEFRKRNNLYSYSGLCGREVFRQLTERLSKNLQNKNVYSILVKVVSPPFGRIRWAAFIIFTP
jgi:hypothetical protein